MKLFFNSPFFCFVLILFSSLHLRAQNVPLTEVDELPNFPGGIPALKKYLDTGLGFPQVTDLAVEKLVIVKFVVGSNGKVRSPKAIWSNNDTANVEAVKLIAKMPNWYPALNDDLPVACYISVPIIYYLPAPSESTLNDHALVPNNIRDQLYFNYDFPGTRTPASFPGGRGKMKQFLAENLDYPPIAEANGVFGTVIIGFTVKKDGLLDNIKALKGIGAGCDEEAIRLIKAMPTWVPATEDGQAIPSEQKIVVNFKVDEEATSHVYENVDEMPAFPSGQQGLKLFFANNLRYPEDAKATSIEGTVIVHSVVEKNGRLSSLMVSQSVSESLDREAIRLMKLMPYWNPGKLNGNPERVVIYLPIRFKLK